MPTEQEIAYHRSFLSPRYSDNFRAITQAELLRRTASDIEAIRLRDPDVFERARESLAMLLKVPYRRGYMRVYVGDQGGRDHWVDGNPSDAQVAECMVPLYPPQGVVRSPTTGAVALPLFPGMHKALLDSRSLYPVYMYQKLDQDFAVYATPWELQCSNLVSPYDRGFTPIVDNSWTVIGYLGSFQGRGLDYQGAGTGMIVPSEFAGRVSLEKALEKDIPVFVHKGNRIPDGWADSLFGTTEDMYEVRTGIDGEVVDARASSTGGLISPWYSPFDLYCAAKVLVSLTKLGTKMVSTLVRKATLRLEARAALKGATKKLAEDATKTAVRDEAEDTIVERIRPGDRVLSEGDLRPLHRVKGRPSRVMSGPEMVTYLKDIMRKRPYLARLRAVRSNEALLEVIQEWRLVTGKSFLKVTKGTVTRLGSEGVGGWALDTISGKEVMIIEGDIFKNEARAAIEVAHELAYEAVREGPDLAIPHLDIPAGTGAMRNAMQWLESVIESGDRTYELLRTMGQPLTRQ
jgi:hypothetical protein